MTDKRLTSKTVTKKRRGANQASAALSTGPRSTRGKARVARNALKHGIFAKAVLFGNEKPEEFAALHGLLVSSLSPVDEFEELLVEKIAVALWRTRRLLRYEQSKVDLAVYLSEHNSAGPGTVPGRIERTSLLAMEDLERLLKYEGLLEKEWMRFYLLLEQRRLIRAENPSAFAKPRSLPLEAGEGGNLSNMV